MKILLSMKFITLPVNRKAVPKKVCVYEGETLLFDFDCKVDMLSPEFTAYVDLSRFMGKTVDITITPDMNFEIGMANEMNLPMYGQEPLRPQVHFTVPNGWNNDPNGLIKYHGIYHMFYQFNPCASEWGNMHWGHATSTDLIHWEHKDAVLYPDEMGTMYSGSAIEDSENRTGLQTGPLPPLLLYYTAAGKRSILSQDKTHTQCLAYSTDGGQTFVKYHHNPVVETIDPQNRDPKVVYVEELGKYLMILYLHEAQYQMLTSSDLLHWQFLQEITIHGDHECPDIYPILCERKRMWVISGAYHTYLVGHFTSKAFIPDGEEKRITYSDISYASQSFSGMDDGRTVKIAWNKLKIPCAQFSQQMGVPAEMQLEKVQDKYYLSAKPIREFEALRAKEQILRQFILRDTLRFDVGANPLDVILQMPYVPDTVLKLHLFGAVISLNTSTNLLTFKNVKMPISILQNRIDLRVVVDRCSFEVYADGGKCCFTILNICDYNLPYIELEASSTVDIDRFACYTLKSVYQ